MASSTLLDLRPKKSPKTTDKKSKLDSNIKTHPHTMSSPLPEPPSDALTINGADQHQPQPEPKPIAPQGPYKSFRKKWRKMRINFEHAMEEANDLFIREHKAWDIARRLQEQNDQLLDIIADLELEAYPNKHPEGSWQHTLPEAFNLSTLVKQTVHSAHPLTDNDDSTAFASLPPDLQELPSLDHGHALPPGYMTSSHETAYLDALDAALAHPPQTEKAPSSMEAVHPPLPPQREKHILREADFAQRYPKSVHNWLRTNKPEMFIEKERSLQAAADKASDRSGQSPAPGGASGAAAAAAAAAKKSSKKKSAAATLADRELKEKQDAPFESLDEDIGFDAAADQQPSTGGGGKGKRKRDDETYRPKGGSSKARSRKKGKGKDGEGEGGETGVADAADA